MLSGNGSGFDGGTLGRVTFNQANDDDDAVDDDNGHIRCDVM